MVKFLIFVIKFEGFVMLSMIGKKGVWMSFFMLEKFVLMIIDVSC